MRVLVVHHGPLSPSAGVPTTGGALRARVHATALAGAGHEVLTLARAQDDVAPSSDAPWRVLVGFRSPGHLRRRVTDVRPDAVVCVAPEEAPALRGLAPLAVDLYAPRMLEGAFEGLQREEAGRTLAAVAAADEVLFSNPRQRWFFLGVLGAAGWDLSTACGRLVPLAAVDDRAAGPTGPLTPVGGPELPTFVLGGNPWPWQDPSETLRRAVAHLGSRARVVTVGVPACEGAQTVPRLDRAAWLDLLAGSAAVLDRYAPNPERALALSFRQLDAIAVGAPLVTDADTPLAAHVRRSGHGWADLPLEEALDAALALRRDDAFARRAADLAATFAPEVTEAPLLDWVAAPRARARGWNLLAAGAQLARAEARTAVAEAGREAAAAEAAAKREEIAALNAQVRALAGAVEASASALADVAGFRREVANVLGTRLAGREAESEHLRRELEIARAEIDKKTRELEAAQVERDRVGSLLARLRGR